MRWAWMIALMLLLGGGCARRAASPPPTERQLQINRLQDFSREKGFPRTGNFERTDKRKHAYYLCYFAKKWELPEDYIELGYRESDERGCRIDSARYDVYFHRVEAVAMEDTPVTQSLEEATDERALMVAAHEEVHEDPQLHHLPPAVVESATTLLGMLTAAEFALREGDIATATHLSEDARIFHRKAISVNALHAELRRLYARHRAGKLNREETAAEKLRLFEEHTRACGEFGRAHSINPCLPVENNAGLAFEHSYTRIYPHLYQLFEAKGSRLDPFLLTLRALGVNREKSVASLERRIRQEIAQAAKSTGAGGGLAGSLSGATGGNQR